jgi:hypothetical protein
MAFPLLSKCYNVLAVFACAEYHIVIFVIQFPPQKFKKRKKIGIFASLEMIDKNRQQYILFPSVSETATRFQLLTKNYLAVPSPLLDDYECSHH